MSSTNRGGTRFRSPWLLRATVASLLALGFLRGFAPPPAWEHSSLPPMSPPLNYFLSTDRLGFDHWTPDYLPLAMALWTDPKVTRLLGGPLSPQRVEERLRREIALQDSRGVQYWPIFLRATAEHVGCAGLRPYQQTD